ncbi:DUF309 domain-containing protein [Metabacillus sp. 84]|uniref:DUF309 domain-containing protein n=1 Tax=unclassified Metabacillus TaxID=2675274 RepID=UPI003CFACF9C
MYPEAYIDYLVHFHGDRDYFECHEILEEYWKEKPPAERDPVWVSLIQIAVALYHHRRGNFKGAERLIKNSLRFLNDSPGKLLKLGLIENEVKSLLETRLLDIQSRHPYGSLHLPIGDTELEKACRHRAASKGMKWQSLSDLNNDDIIHRHRTRDRSEVIEERLNQLMLKKEAGQKNVESRRLFDKNE